MTGANVIHQFSIRAAVLLVLASIVASCAQESDPEDSTSTTITILGTNDFHGALVQKDGFGGLSMFAAYVGNVREIRKSDGGAVVLIDAGDMWQGTLESNLNEGVAVLHAYEALQYDAVTIGNHEFDFGPAGPRATPESDADDAQGALRARAAEAGFPFIAANLIDSHNDRPVGWDNVSPSIMIEKAGVSIGIIGVITEHALETTIVANVRGLAVAPLLSSVRDEATFLRQNGADVVIVAAHAGAECAIFDDPDDLSSCDLDGEVFRLAAGLPKGLVDVLIGGHVHKGIAHNLNGISVISSFSGGRAFGRVDLNVDLEHSRVVSKTVFAPQRICNANNIVTEGCRDGATYEGLPLSSDHAVAGIVDRAVDDVRQFKERELGVLVESAFVMASSPDSPLGNLLTDVMLQASGGAEIAIHNTLGGVRAGIPAGPLTFGDIYEAFPFDNLLVQLSIDGAALKRVFEYQLRNGQWRAGVSGLHVVATCQGPELEITLIRDDGHRVQDEDILTVATTDFLATGGDAVFAPIMPAAGFTFSSSAPRYRDKIVSWMENRGGVLRRTDFFDPSDPRFTFPGETPVSCTTPQDDV